jgi:multidrug efflux pump subunit AcrB
MNKSKNPTTKPAKESTATKSEKLTTWQKFGMLFYRRGKLTLTLWIAVFSFGLLSYTNLMARQGFPSINVAAGFAQIVSVGQDAATLDREVSQNLITKAKEDPNLKDVSTNTNDQGVTLNLTYKDGTDVAAALKKLDDYSRTILPEGAQAFFAKFEGGKLTQKGDDILVSVYANDLSAQMLDQKAETVATFLSTKLPLAQKVTVDHQIQKGVDELGQPVDTQISYDRYYKKDVTAQVSSATIVAIQGVANVDQLKLYDQVKSVLESSEFKTMDINAHISADFAESIREQIGGLQRNLLEGLLVVLIVSFFLINWRASVITALAMATTVIVTVGILNLIGYSLNTITLFSLVLCLALIVDDTTIVVEAIDHGLKKGQKIDQVVRETFKKVARASATGTLTTMLAFAPMLFIGGVLGKFIRAIPITIIISLLVSILVSFIFIPLMMRATLRFGKVSKQRKSVAERVEDSFSGLLIKCIKRLSANWKVSTFSRIFAVVISISTLVIAFTVVKKVEFNIFPAPKDGIDMFISGRVVDKETASLDATAAATDQILAIAKNQLGSDLESITLSGQAGAPDRYGFYATIILSDLSERKVTSVELAEKLTKALAETNYGMIIKAEAAGVGPPAGEFAAQIKVDNEENAYVLARQVADYMQTASLTRTNSTTATFKDISITPKKVITRNKTDRIVTISSGFSAKDTSTLVTLGQESIEKQFPAAKDQLSFNFGQEEENQDSFASMGKAVGPLFLAMFLLITFLFRSVLQPLLIFTAIPFTFIGITEGLYRTNNPISFFSMLGVFALIGISMNNTILLTDYANQARKEGENAIDAIAVAIRERIRPLITTSVTSVFALLPLALNDPFWEGLAYTLIFGLISSTILVLTIFPYFYLIADNIGSMFRRGWKLVRK